MNALGIVPARSGSKRVPQKNFRPFAGTTLVDLAIQQSLEATCLDDLLVSSDSPEVLDIARKHGVIALERPSELAQDLSPAIDYQVHALHHMREVHAKSYDFVVVLQPSSPFRNGPDIDNTLQLLRRYPEADSAVSVVEVQHMVHPSKLKTMDGDFLIPFLVDEGEKTAAHMLANVFVRNCAVYVFKTNNVLQRGIMLGKRSVGYVMLPERSIDINSPLEFEFAEYLFKRSANTIEHEGCDLIASNG